MEIRSMKSDVVSALVAVLGHGLIWCVFLLGLMVLVPRADRTIRDFNMSVPELTAGVLTGSRWTSR
jgi:hypothetical protein